MIYEKKEERVIKRYCDVPMARKKRYLPCDNNCKKCLACIEQTVSGEKRHVSFGR